MMKSHVWIFLLISISTFIDATSNDSTSAAVKFILSPSTLTRGNSTNSSGILIQGGNISSSAGSMATQITRQPIFHSTTSTVMDRSHQTALSKRKRSADEQPPECDAFTKGLPGLRAFTSPGFPGNYTKNITCVKVLTAEVGYFIKLDFREIFHIEPSEGCKFDYLEIRNGEHGFSDLVARYCGNSFPEEFTSKSRHLWLQFKSDENIEYGGFKAVYDWEPRPSSGVYDDLPCGETFTSPDGVLNKSLISKEKMDKVIETGLFLDCLWKIEMPEGQKISLTFPPTGFKLDKPNECDKNFMAIYRETTDMTHQEKVFCGSMADSVTLNSNICYIQFYASHASAQATTFEILYTGFREKIGKESCKAGEFDCDDQTCIHEDLMCNGHKNCRFEADETQKTAECDALKQKPEGEGDGENKDNMMIILCVFGVMMGILSVVFLVNCMRKIIRDHKIIREHIRQSRESKLDELGRHSTKLTKSRENIALEQLTKLPPPAFDPDSHSSFNEGQPTNHHFYRDTMPSGNGARILDSKNDLHLREQEIKNILGSSYDDERKDSDAMCDMACQTRESLFQPVFKNKVTQSPMPSNLRFSTFGYQDPQVPGAPPSCPSHGPSKQNTLPHQHSHHHHYHHIHSSSNKSSPDVDKGVGTSEAFEVDERTKKILVKKDDAQARSYSDVRKSAPDVIIIAGCTSSH